jgi:5-methylcytosine-specific restriction endonuclease McrA
LRRLSLKYPGRIEALNKTKHTYYIKSKHGKDLKRVSWTCEKCGKSGLTSKERELDHIIPVSDESGYGEIGKEFLDGLFCDSSNYQVLCISCHSEKSKLELEKRVDFRNKK